MQAHQRLLGLLLGRLREQVIIGNLALISLGHLAPLSGAAAALDALRVLIIQGIDRVKLAFYPDPVLLKPAERIEEITEEVRAKALAMIPFMELEGGVGLAAPQVSWGVQLLLASESGKPEETTVLINPTITWKSKEMEWGEEGCLSFPEIYGEVQRAVAIKVEATDLDGKAIELEAEDFFARVLQHEIDHLNGDIFINKMRPADKAQNRAAIVALKKKFEERQARALD